MPRFVVDECAGEARDGRVVDQLVVVRKPPAARRGLRYRLGDEAPRRLPLHKFGLEEVGELGHLLCDIVWEMGVQLVELGVGR